MIDLTELQRRFPEHTIRSQPAPGCGCKGTGIRHIARLNMDRPCLCVCMSAPTPGEKEYRVDLGRALAESAKRALDEMQQKGGAA
jgi:hypothetical protein